MIGSVYFIREGETGPIKIGWTSKDVERRRDSLQTGNSKTLILIGFIADVAHSVETEWHIRFRDLHLRAEWFHPGRNLLNAIADSATAVEQKPSRGYRPKGLSEPREQTAGARCVLEWMARHDLDSAAVAELTGYKLGYLEDLLESRTLFGRETAKRFHALGGDELHPSRLLDDRRDYHCIKPYLARVGEAG